MTGKAEVLLKIVDPRTYFVVILLYVFARKIMFPRFLNAYKMLASTYSFTCFLLRKDQMISCTVAFAANSWPSARPGQCARAKLARRQGQPWKVAERNVICFFHNP